MPMRCPLGVCGQVPMECWVLFGCKWQRKMTNNMSHTHLFRCRKHWVQNKDPRQLHLPRQAPAEIGCLPTVHLIRRMTNNVFHNKLFHGGKH